MRLTLPLLGLLLLGVALGLPARVRALGWQVPPGCPERAAAEQALAELSVASEAVARADVRIDVAPQGQLRARVKLQPDDPERFLYAGSCRALSDAALLVISLGSAHATGQQRDARDDAGRVRDAPPGRLALSAAGLFDSHSLPAPSFGAGAALGGAFGRWRVELTGGYWPERVAALAGSEGGELGVTLYAFGVRGCCGASGAGTSLPRWPDLGLCAGAELGRMHARSTGLTQAGEHSAPWSAALLGLAAALGPWARLSPTLQVELAVPLQRPAFDVGGLDTVHHAAPVTLRLALGLRVDLVR